MYYSKINKSFEISFFIDLSLIIISNQGKNLVTLNYHSLRDWNELTALTIGLNNSVSLTRLNENELKNWAAFWSFNIFPVCIMNSISYIFFFQLDYKSQF